MSGKEGSETVLEMAIKPRRPMTLRAALSLLIAGALIATAGTGFWLWSGAQLAGAQTANDAARTAYSKRAAAQMAADIAKGAADSDAAFAAESLALIDGVWAKDGFLPAGEGLYYKFADQGEGSCGYFDCAFVFVATTDACNAGVYVAASLMAGQTSVGYTNDISGGLAAGGHATMTLQDAEGAADSFRITDVHCLG